MIGEKLRSARLARGMSMRDLAAAADVSHSAIGKYESDKDMPSSSALLALCRSLGVALDWLMRPTQLKVSEPSFRKRRAFGIKKQRAVVERAREFLERYILAEELAVGGVVHFRSPQAVKDLIWNLDDIESVATTLRIEWNLGLDPIDYLIEALEGRGVKIVVLDIDDDNFDGCSFYLNDSVPVVIISSCWTGDRQRFTIAHEIGHLALKFDENKLKQEAVANRFAGSFLLPAETVKNELGAHRSSFMVEELLALKHKYGVSMSCWIRRAKDLHIISDSLFKRLMILFKQRGWHKQEPNRQVKAEKPFRFERLVYKSLVEGAISERKAAELVGSTITDLRAIIRPLGERSQFAQASR